MSNNLTQGMFRAAIVVTATVVSIPLSLSADYQREEVAVGPNEGATGGQREAEKRESDSQRRDSSGTQSAQSTQERSGSSDRGGDQAVPSSGATPNASDAPRDTDQPSSTDTQSHKHR
jgi:hypothetical protein